MCSRSALGGNEVALLNASACDTAPCDVQNATRWTVEARRCVVCPIHWQLWVSGKLLRKTSTNYFLLHLYPLLLPRPTAKMRRPPSVVGCVAIVVATFCCGARVGDTAEWTFRTGDSLNGFTVVGSATPGKSICSNAVQLPFGRFVNCSCYCLFTHFSVCT